MVVAAVVHEVEVEVEVGVKTLQPVDPEEEDVVVVEVEVVQEFSGKLMLWWLIEAIKES